MSPIVIVVVLLIIGAASYAFLLMQKKKAAGVAKPVAAKLAPVALSQREYAPFALQSKVSLTSTFHKTVSYRFALPAGHRLGLPVGKHISLRCITPEGKMVSRPYTPVTSDDDIGFFDLVVKVYAPYQGVDFKTKEPKSFAAGVMGAHLESLKLGDTIDVKGPQGELEYTGKGGFTILRKPKADEKEGKRFTQLVKAKRVGLIAGGTGITPCLAIIREVLKRDDDPTHLSLVFGNVVEEDILLRGELEAFATKFPTRFKCHFVLDKPPAGWTGSGGFVTADVCAANLPAPAEDTLTLLCGPPGMIGAVSKALASLGHKDENLFFF